MSLDLNNLTPASIKAKEVATEEYVDTVGTNITDNIYYPDTTTIDGGKITTNTLQAEALKAGTNNATVWTGGGLVSSNFDGNSYGNIGTPSAGFRLSSDSTGTVNDPNIYGAVIRSPVFVSPKANYVAINSSGNYGLEKITFVTSLNRHMTSYTSNEASYDETIYTGAAFAALDEINDNAIKGSNMRISIDASTYSSGTYSTYIAELVIDNIVLHQPDYNITGYIDRNVYSTTPYAKVITPPNVNPKPLATKSWVIPLTGNIELRNEIILIGVESADISLIIFAETGASDEFTVADSVVVTIDSYGEAFFFDCVITTSTLVALGKSFEDNGEELEILRRFRDTELMETEYGKELVKEYYRISPIITAEISKSGDKEEYSYIWDTYILTAINALKNGFNLEAFQTYKNMVEYLKNKYIKE